MRNTLKLWSALPISNYKGVNMKILVKPTFGREYGRILVMKGNRVVISLHYRHQKHKDIIINEINHVIGEYNE